MFKINKGLCFLSIILVLLIIIPSSFAHENATGVMIDDGSSNPLEINEDAEIIKDTSKDYYFNASAADDSGDGSKDNPYKYLTADRIKANANVYLANGEYNLDKVKSIEQVNFIGCNANQTIIKFDGVAFRAWNAMTLTNLTISDATIMNYATLNATNTIFAHGSGSNKDSYGNNFGGAIYCPYYSGYTPAVNIKNCTFIDNYAEYGGAIYMDGGSLDIIDTMFINNFAYNFGGSIAGEYGVKINITRSKFYNSYSLADAGGAIYIRGSTLKVNDVEIVNSSATFGGAIASLLTDVSLNHIVVNDSVAKWDGGAIYHMYGNFTSYYGNFINNSANNGGALFIDNSTNFFLRNNVFTNNNANMTAGAVYSICNTFKGMSSIRQYNRFNGNSAFFRNDEYSISSINLTIGNGNYTMYKNNVSEVTDLPSYYSLRDFNLLTIPKDQQSSGNCWAFASIAVLESAILKAGGESLDLSEENMKNLMAQFSDYGWDMETNEGGYDRMHIGYLTSWLGPVSDSDDVFDDHGTLSPILNSVMHVQNVLFLKRDNYLDNDAIKKAIMKYGAVGTSMLYDSNFFRWEGYYCWSTSSSNHAVTIVGWDDNYSRDHFYGLSQDKGDGAWIVRNSWGPNWKDNGYFYVSYYDEKLAQPGKDNIAYTYILNDTMRYDRNYQYDIAGETDFYYNGESTLWYKNIFYAEDNEFLAGISTYFEKETNWTASVYVNGSLKEVMEGISNPGYYTFGLDELIYLNSSIDFEVVFKVSRPDVVSFPISEHVSLNKLSYKPGISFISLDGENWVDLFNHSGSYTGHTYSSQVACIKAFTILNEIDTITNLVIDYDGFNPVNITATVIDQYGNLLNNGNVTFNLNGSEFVVKVTNGIAKIAHSFANGLNSISATFNAVGYKSSVDTSEIQISSIRTILLADNIVMSYKDGSAWIVKLIDNMGNMLASGTTVKIGMPGKVYSLKTNDEGLVTLPINFKPGVYQLNATFEGNDRYESSFINATVTVNKASVTLSADNIVMDYKDGTAYLVRLTDANNNPIANAAVAVTIGKSTYNRITDSDGVANLPINLRTGNYTISAKFNGNAIYNGDNITNTIAVLKVTPVLTSNNLVMYYKDGSAYEVSLVDNNGRPIVNEVVKFTICSVTYNIKTNSDGIAKLPINLRVGEYIITAAFGDSCYDYVRVTNTISVNVKASIKADDVNMTYKDGTSYDVQLIDDDGNSLAVPGVTVKFTIGSVSYNIKTDSNGVAKLPINLRPGNYTIAAQYVDKTIVNSIIVNR